MEITAGLTSVREVAALYKSRDSRLSETRTYNASNVRYDAPPTSTLCKQSTVNRDNSWRYDNTMKTSRRELWFILLTF